MSVCILETVQMIEWMYVCIEERGREKKKNLHFVSLIVSTWETRRERRGKRAQKHEGEKRRLAYENIHALDCLKKYVYVLVVIFWCLFASAKCSWWRVRVVRQRWQQQITVVFRAHTKYIETQMHTNPSRVSFDRQTSWCNRHYLLNVIVYHIKT
jgi:hypothetical protein